MIKALIVEDELLAVEKLQMLLEQIDEDIHIINHLESVEMTIDWLSKNEADLIFMDIHLSDGPCFLIFEQIDVKTPIIFTTAYDQYAIKAFKQNSIDYLLKPIDEDQLKQSIEKYKELFQKKSETIDYQKIAGLLSQSNTTYKSRFMVYAGQKLVSLKTEDIAYIFAQDKSVYIVSTGNKTYYTNLALDKLESQLDNEYFFRLNRKIIAHIESVTEATPYSKNKMKVQLHPLPDFDV
ncbi:MAG: LytTR family DNA-binding domain-containing protein, partial [Bacteroidales bacterium]|nr:LytTR family DNA-binding domain-containing protein [Bacteroidales bacterium]